MANEVLPVRYAPLKGLPMAVFHHIVEESRETGAAALMGAFNIQIVSPQHNIDLPPEAVLRTSLMFAGDREYAEIAMVLRDKAYYVAYPNQVLSDMGNAISDLLDDGGTLGKPVFEVHELSGFVFNETTVEKMPVLGVAVTINIRYGDVRVDTMFQWVGRPPSIPFNDGENFLR